jgi:hypothetical protein
LSKRAAKDSQLQKKLIITAINRGVYQSRLFKQVLIHRKTHLSEEDMKKRHIMDLYDVFNDEELAKIAGLEEDGQGSSDEDDENGFESSDSDDEEGGQNAIRDDFLDMPLDFANEARLAVTDSH